MRNATQKLGMAIVVFLALGVSAVLMTGCPMTLDTDLVGIIDDVINPQEGVVVVKGNFFDDADKLAAKSVNLNEVIGRFKALATEMSFVFYPSDGLRGKGGGWDGGVSFIVPIADGWYNESFFIMAGDYDVYVSVYDASYRTLFWANTNISVIAGEVSVLPVLLYLPDYVQFNFVVPGMPGAYYNNGTATITTDSGESYPVY